MESSQEQHFLNPINLASNSETEDPIIRLSSSSSCSSSSCSSIEAEPKPDQNQTINNVEQSPQTQIMERSTDNNNQNTTTSTTSNPNTPSYRIPSRVFSRTTSTTPVEWSTLSNESLFSIHMGNNSFNAREYFKSGELTFPQPPSPMTPSLPSPSPSPVVEGVVVAEEEVKSPVDIGKKAAETDKAYRASKEDEQKAAASIREVIMANEAANKDNDINNNKNNKLDRSVSRRSENLTVKSFAFPVLGNADKGGLQGSVLEKKQTEIPKISTEVEGDDKLKKEEPLKSVTPKAEADRVSNRNPRWLSCFPCCTTFCF